MVSTTWAVAGPLCGRPVDQPLGRPFGIVSVGGRHVRRDRTVAAFEGGAPVAGHAFALVEEFHHLGTQADLELLLDQRVGHRVVVAFDFDVVIDIDAGEFPLGIFIGLRGQGPEGGAVERLKQLCREPGSFLKGRALSAGRRGWRAALTSAREKKVWCRSRARIQRSTTCTPTSTLALSRGLAARAGMTAKP